MSRRELMRSVHRGSVAGSLFQSVVETRADLPIGVARLHQTSCRSRQLVAPALVLEKRLDLSNEIRRRRGKHDILASRDVDPFTGDRMRHHAFLHRERIQYLELGAAAVAYRTDIDGRGVDQWPHIGQIAV